MSDKLDIMILGKSLRIAAENADELNNLQLAARILDQKMNNIRNQNPSTPIEKIAILAALNSTHELLLFQKEVEQHLDKIQDLVVG
ncbi:MAG: cell division protein ZapA [Taibaiella sp.]|jgi:cell division protein ZapA